jgi:hypothetical protein
VVRARRFLLALVPLAALGACRGIAGLRDIAYSDAVDGACSSPSLPSTGNGHIRLVDAATSAPSDVDFCIRASGSTDWGSPVFANGGPACQPGLEYGQVTVPFGVPAGSIDVEAIPAGSPCSAQSTSVATNVPVGDASQGAAVVTIVRFGGGAAQEQIVALPEEPPGANYAGLVRFVNALSSGDSIDVGIAASAALPTTIATEVFPVPVPAGGVEPANQNPALPVDGAGYLHSPSLALNLGAALHGQTSALFVAPSSPEDTLTVFALGDPTSVDHPARGLRCEDGTPSAGAGGDAASATGSVLASCTLTTLPSLAIDTFNVDLYGAGAPFEADRRQPVFDAIASRGTDLVCITNISRDGDKQALAQAAKSRFPYAFFATTTLDDPATDPTTADGSTPPTPTSAPCAGVAASTIDPIEQCLAAHCVTGDAGIQTTACLGQACAPPLVVLASSEPACYDCLIYYLASEVSLSDGRNACTTDTRAPLAFGGMSYSMLLSHYPLAATQAFELPSTGFRRTLLYADVVLEDGQHVDYYCAHLSSPLVASSIPYTGQYGATWEDEQDVQIAKVVRFIQAKSATTHHPAIIAGDWRASMQIDNPEDGGTPILVASSPEVMWALDSADGGAFVRATPDGQVPVCEYCPSPQNPYNGNTKPEDFTMTFLLGFPAGATVEDSFWDTDFAVQLTPVPYEAMPDGGVGPRSQNWPRVVRVTRPLVTH